MTRTFVATFGGAFGLTVALLLAATQTVGPAFHSPLGIDEQVSYYIAAGDTPSSVFARATQQSATPPGYFWLAGGSYNLGERFGAGAEEIALRAPSLLFAVASLLLIYRFGQHAGGFGLAAVLLTAGHPQFLFHATQARPYIAGVFFNLAAGWCAYRLCQPGWSWRHWVGLAISNVCLLWTHYVFAVAVAIQPALWVLAPKTKTADARPPAGTFAGMLFSAACVLSLIPLTTAILAVQARGQFLNWVTEYRPWHKAFELLLLADGPTAAFPSWAPLAIATAVAVACRAIGRLRRKHEDQASADSPDLGSLRMFAFFVVWAAGPVVLIWLAGWTVDPALAQSRYLATQIGPVCLAMAAGLAIIGTNRGSVAAAVAMLVAAGVVQRTVDVLQNPVRQDRYWQNAALFLNDNAQADDVILVQSGLVETKLVAMHFADPAFQEYATSRLSDFYFKVPASRLSLPLYWPPPGSPALEWRDDYERQIQAAFAGGGRAWMVVSADSDVGEAVEAGAEAWLSAAGFQVRQIDDNRVARLYRIDRPSISGVP